MLRLFLFLSVLVYTTSVLAQKTNYPLSINHIPVPVYGINHDGINVRRSNIRLYKLIDSLSKWQGTGTVKDTGILHRGEKSSTSPVQSSLANMNVIAPQTKLASVICYDTSSRFFQTA